MPQFESRNKVARREPTDDEVRHVPSPGLPPSRGHDILAEQLILPKRAGGYSLGTQPTFIEQSKVQSEKGTRGLPSSASHRMLLAEQLNTQAYCELNGELTPHALAKNAAVNNREFLKLYVDIDSFPHETFEESTSRKILNRLIKNVTNSLGLMVEVAPPVPKLETVESPILQRIISLSHSAKVDISYFPVREQGDRLYCLGFHLREADGGYAGVVAERANNPSFLKQLRYFVPRLYEDSDF